MIEYPIDLSKSYRIIDVNREQDTVKIEGCSKIIRTTDGEFGGVCGIWKDVPVKKLLNKEQRRKLSRKHRLYGDEEANRYYLETCAQVIAEHSNTISV